MVGKVFRLLGEILHRRILRSPFFYVLLPSVVFYAYALYRHWIPHHDTFQLATINYFIFNEFVQNGSIPFWYPYLNYGIDANWYLAISVGPSLAFLLPFAKFFSSANFLTIFYLGFFLDELALLVGTYMLSRELFSSRLAVVFVCITMAGSALWFSQPWWNFHLYYYMPLALYFTTQGCRWRSLWQILLGGAVLAMTVFGNLPYFPFVQGLAFAAFLLFSAWAYGFSLRDSLRNSGGRELAVLALLAVAAGAFLFIMTRGVEHISYNVGRAHGNVSSIEEFLTYAKNASTIKKYTEIFTGTSWNFDMNIYSGALTLAMAIFGLMWAPSRRQLPFFGTAALFFLFSLGKESFIAPLSYFLPTADLYRHIDYVIPLIKVMLIFLSGFGFDALVLALHGRDEGQPGDIKTVSLMNIGLLAFMLAACVSIAVVTFYTLTNSNSPGAFAPMYDLTYGSEYTSRFANKGIFASRVAFMVMLYLFSIGVFVMVAVRKKAVAAMAIYALLAVQAVDVYSYRFSMFNEYMIPVSDEYWELFEFRPGAFVTERVQDYSDTESFKIFAKHYKTHGAPESGLDREWFDDCKKQKSCSAGEVSTMGVVYASTEPFLGIDPCRSIFRFDYWRPGVDRLYRAEMGMPLDDPTVMPKGYMERTIAFPWDSGKFNKAIGCGTPKLQVFDRLAVARSGQDLSAILHDPGYGGDLLLTSRESYEDYEMAARAMSFEGYGSVRQPAVPEVPFLSGDSRVKAEIAVRGFTANSIEIGVSTPANDSGYWLYYADASHPFWEASVDGKGAPILEANFGFKAVAVPSGDATVRFAYNPHGIDRAFMLVRTIFFGLMSLIILKSFQLLFSLENIPDGQEGCHKKEKAGT